MNLENEYAIIDNGRPIVLAPGRPFKIGNKAYPANVLVLWSIKDLRKHGIYVVQSDPIFAGKEQVRTWVTFDGTIVRRHYEWRDAAPAVVPKVSAAQAKVALFRRRHLDKIEEIIKKYPRDVQIWFNDARDWERYNPYVVGIGYEIFDFETADSEMDELFWFASRLLA